MTPPVVQAKGSETLINKIVIRLPELTVKGTTELDEWIHSFLESDDLLCPPIQVSNKTVQRFDLKDVKAVFFVKTVEGGSHDELRYHDNITPLPSIWVRVTFLDGESIEGIVRNELSFLVRSKFLMAPVDPESNNDLILVFKDQIVDFKILGLRKSFEDLPDYFKESRDAAEISI